MVFHPYSPQEDGSPGIDVQVAAASTTSRLMSRRKAVIMLLPACLALICFLGLTIGVPALRENHVENIQPTTKVINSNQTPFWMSYLPDNTPITRISIPATHDSMAYLAPDYVVLATGLPDLLLSNPARAAEATLALGAAQAGNAINNNFGIITPDFVQTQNKTLFQQLSAGVRAFDIRCVLTNTDQCILAHPPMVLKETPLGPLASFNSVFRDVNEFLNRNPTETVILSVTFWTWDEMVGLCHSLTDYFPTLFAAAKPHVIGPDPATTTKPGDAFKNYISNNDLNHRWIIGNASDPSFLSMTLGMARNKSLVILRLADPNLDKSNGFLAEDYESNPTTKTNGILVINADSPSSPYALLPYFKNQVVNTFKRISNPSLATYKNTTFLANGSKTTQEDNTSPYDHHKFVMVALSGFYFDMGVNFQYMMTPRMMATGEVMGSPVFIGMNRYLRSIGGGFMGMVAMDFPSQDDILYIINNQGETPLSFNVNLPDGTSLCLPDGTPASGLYPYGLNSCCSTKTLAYTCGTTKLTDGSTCGLGFHDGPTGTCQDCASQSAAGPTIWWNGKRFQCGRAPDGTACDGINLIPLINSPCSMCSSSMNWWDEGAVTYRCGCAGDGSTCGLPGKSPCSVCCSTANYWDQVTYRCGRAPDGTACDSPLNSPCSVCSSSRSWQDFLTRRCGCVANSNTQCDGLFQLSCSVCCRGTRTVTTGWFGAQQKYCN